jgi:hypothetical protein
VISVVVLARMYVAAVAEAVGAVAKKTPMATQLNSRRNTHRQAMTIEAITTNNAPSQ